jgi:homoserine kinase type II
LTLCSRSGQDPGSVALLTALPLDRARELGRAYSVDIVRLEPLSLGSVNSNFRAFAADGRELFARLYEEQGAEGAEAEVRLLSALARRGCRVPEALPLVLSLPLHAGKPFVVFPWVQGEILCLARVDAAACRAVGAALAGVHLATPGLTRLGPGRFGPSDMLARLDRVERESQRADLSADVARVRALYARLVAERDGSLPSGIVHGDLFRDNVLWKAGEITALLDFESAFHGPFVYDLMVTIAAWCYRDVFELPLARALVEGYVAVRPLTASERAAARVEGALACLRFATSRITDFELRAAPGARPARDFRRFLARLDAIVAGALDPALG